MPNLTSVNVEHCEVSLSEQRRAASFDLTTRLQHSGHACLLLAGIKSGLLLTSIDSEHTT